MRTVCFCGTTLLLSIVFRIPGKSLVGLSPSRYRNANMYICTLLFSLYLLYKFLNRYNLPIVCIHNLSLTPSCGYFIQYICAIFIDGISSVSESYSSTITATPPWHVHVTKSPMANSCFGAFLKKSFTRS